MFAALQPRISGNYGEWTELGSGDAPPNTGKYYVDVKIVDAGSRSGPYIGLIESGKSLILNGESTGCPVGWFIDRCGGRRIYNGSDSSLPSKSGQRMDYPGGESFDTGDVCGVLLDTESRSLSFLKNGEVRGPAKYFTALPQVPLKFAIHYADAENGGKVEVQMRSTEEAELAAQVVGLASSEDMDFDGTWQKGEVLLEDMIEAGQVAALRAALERAPDRMDEKVRSYLNITGFEIRNAWQRPLFLRALSSRPPACRTPGECRCSFAHTWKRRTTSPPCSSTWGRM
jgi:hypothetical protein